MTDFGDLVPVENYLSGHFGAGVDRGRSMPMNATRGCPYQCTFCSSPLMWTTRYVTRAPADVVAEIKQYMAVGMDGHVANFEHIHLVASTTQDQPDEVNQYERYERRPDDHEHGGS